MNMGWMGITRASEHNSYPNDDLHCLQFLAVFAAVQHVLEIFMSTTHKCGYM